MGGAVGRRHGVLPDGTAPDLGGAAAGATGALNGNLLNVDVNLDANAGITAPINGAVAANANVAAPIDAAVAANIGSIDSNAYRRLPAGRDHQPGHRGRGDGLGRSAVEHPAVTAR